MQWQGEKKINFVVLTLISILAYGKLSLSTLWIYEYMGVNLQKEEKSTEIS